MRSLRILQEQPLPPDSVFEVNKNNTDRCADESDNEEDIHNRLNNTHTHGISFYNKNFYSRSDNNTNNNVAGMMNSGRHSRNEMCMVGQSFTHDRLGQYNTESLKENSELALNKQRVSFRLRNNNNNNNNNYSNNNNISSISPTTSDVAFLRSNVTDAVKGFPSHLMPNKPSERKREKPKIIHHPSRVRVSTDHTYSNVNNNNNNSNSNVYNNNNYYALRSPTALSYSVQLSQYRLESPRSRLVQQHVNGLMSYNSVLTNHTNTSRSNYYNNRNKFRNGGGGGNNECYCSIRNADLLVSAARVYHQVNQPFIMHCVGRRNDIKEALFTICSAASSEPGYNLVKSIPGLLKRIKAIARFASTISIRCVAQLCFCIMARCKTAAKEMPEQGFAIVQSANGYVSSDGVPYAVAYAHVEPILMACLTRKSVRDYKKNTSKQNNTNVNDNNSNNDNNKNADKYSVAHFAYTSPNFVAPTHNEVPKRISELIYALANPVKKENSKTALYKIAKRTPHMLCAPAVLKLLLDCASVYQLRHAERKFVADLIASAMKTASQHAVLNTNSRNATSAMTVTHNTTININNFMNTNTTTIALPAMFA